MRAHRGLQGLSGVTTKQYLAALKKLGLTPAGNATAAALGLSVRHCMRLAAGARVTAPVARLLQLMLERRGPAPLGKIPTDRSAP